MEINQIDVRQGRGNKDFGKGLYMAVTKKQAIGMMHKKHKEAVRRSRNKKEAQFKERLYDVMFKGLLGWLVRLEPENLGIQYYK